VVFVSDDTALTEIQKHLMELLDKYVLADLISRLDAPIFKN